MKQRLLNNWSVRRALYLLIGLAIAIQSAYTREWFGIVAGSYFAAMGLFGFGCAGGQCAPIRQRPEANDEIQFEEVS
jgi:hypothetical protein